MFRARVDEIQSAPRRPRIALVSSYDEACGNATYTECVRKGLTKIAEVRVFALDLLVLQDPSSSSRSLARAHIDKIVRELSGFDAINIQFEAGLYGANPDEQFRNFSVLLDSNKNVLVTMHRVELPTVPSPFTMGLRAWRHHPVSWRRVKARVLTEKSRHLYRSMVAACARKAKTGNVQILVHTKREARIIREHFGFDAVSDYPLMFLSRDERERHRKANPSFKTTIGMPNQKLLGLFGAFGGYKGFETAIRAMKYLPDYQLVFFGAQHPQSVRVGVSVDPNVRRLLDMIEGRIDGFDDISDRVLFAGNVPDDLFIAALRNCDAVALPYLEVGQSMSGVLALGIEAGANLMCANNLSFTESKRYFPNSFYSFDIGNYLELAERVRLSNHEGLLAQQEADLWNLLLKRVPQSI